MVTRIPTRPPVRSGRNSAASAVGCAEHSEAQRFTLLPPDFRGGLPAQPIALCFRAVSTTYKTVRRTDHVALPVGQRIPQRRP